jgi:predicted Zn-dependent protease
MAELDFAAAATSFQRAVEEEPDNSFAWNNLGYAFIEQKNFEEAAAALEHATSGTSPTGYMWNNLGMAYEHLDRIREARAAYRQAAEAGSTKGEANLERLEGVTSLRPSEAAEVETVSDGSAAVTTDVTTDEEGSVGGPTLDPQEEEPGC